MSENKYPDFLETTGYGTGEGLCGWNCRHGFHPWDERLTYRPPEIDEEKSKKQYDLSQKQRAMERAIRKTKRQLIVKQEQINASSGESRDNLQAEYDAEAYRLQQQNKAYNDFCEKHDLQPQYERNRLAGFGATQTKAANKGARRYQNVKKEQS